MKTDDFIAEVHDDERDWEAEALKYAESIGVSVIAAVVEVHTTMVTIQPSSLNITPAMPGIMVRGMNTATTTSVVAITESHTSLVA